MKYSELERKLAKGGCYEVGNAGHPLWFSPVTGRTFPTGHHKNQEVKPKTLANIRKQSGVKF
jgi:predicted RNA binding protein YcfA (HicA-like mRNA interferase family)